ncbi:MAG: arginine--tRNA ligase [Pseudomonadales bacterium]|nr:arginine--tRNA ligase [Pseudomonadales bacterium]
MNVRALLTERFEAALAAVLGEAVPANVQPAGRPEFGDYQVNGIMPAAKRMRGNPRALAEQVLARVAIDDLVEPPEIAGPGFINLTLKVDFLAETIGSMPLLATTAHPERIVVDYSSPNLAKEMHVGHLRSTIIGDALARLLAALGHTVIRQNHVGDWGTQFGMLLTYLDETGANSAELADLEQFYRAAKARFDDDPAFAARSRETVVRLQQGDAHAREAWQRFIDVSLAHCQAIYDRLGVTLSPADVYAESAYNDALADIVAELDRQGLATASDGATCVFLDEFKGKDGEPLPVIVQKSDGGYLYATTDLAAVRYRSRTLAADRVLYLTDARQALHFRQIFAVARRAGFANPTTRLEHMPFGAMLGTDGRPFRTRAGEVVKLAELLDEAEARALALVAGKNPELPEDERRAVARAVGIGAVKYADLSKNRASDYVFDWNQMLAFEGNTAPYLQYACTRIQSIFRRGEVTPETLPVRPAIDERAERQLAVLLVRFQEIVEQVAEDGCPHLLCGYLYELSTAFMRFYEACPILNADAGVRASRLRLCARTGDTLRLGLGLLGIETVERM